VIYPRLIGQGIHLHPMAVILAILCGAELAGVAGIFLAIPVIALLTVSYGHWLEHRGSEGLVSDLLQPVEKVLATAASGLPGATAAGEPDLSPTTTPEEMARARPDLTTGELKMPVE
jgi:membrane-associated protease RseP (regulator of RpoE activity)